MLLLIPLLLALGVALLRGGSLRALAALPIRGRGCAVAALTIQLGLYLPGVRESPLAFHVAGALYLCTLALLVVAALSNWRLGMAARIAALGLCLNTIAIAANDGSMPVNAAAMRQARGASTVQNIAAARAYTNVHMANGSTRLVFLSDILPLRILHGPGNVYSIGDVLLAAGLATLVYKATRRPLTA